MNAAVENVGLVPLKMYSSVVKLNQYLTDWSLADAEENSSETRSYVCDICFESPFSNVPLVQAAIVGFDIDNRDTLRLKVRVENIRNTGFQLIVQTQLQTRVYEVEVSWLALGHA